mgnify:CR=1 FL=1
MLLLPVAEYVLFALFDCYSLCGVTCPRGHQAPESPVGDASSGGQVSVYPVVLRWSAAIGDLQGKVSGEGEVSMWYCLHSLP